MLVGLQGKSACPRPVGVQSGREVQQVLARCWGRHRPVEGLRQVGYLRTDRRRGVGRRFGHLQPGAPERFAGAVESLPTEGPIAEFVKEFQDRVSKGIDPLYVGELVREGIENDWPYIFTDTEFEHLIDERFAAIKQGFDRIRGRQPRH